MVPTPTFVQRMKWCVIIQVTCTSVFLFFGIFFLGVLAPCCGTHRLLSHGFFLAAFSFSMCGRPNKQTDSFLWQGLRMHPLSWNIYGGHVDNAALLLEYGADVNADFDSMKKEDGAVTSLDIVLQLQDNEQGDERFVQLEKVLRRYGAKTMAELLKLQQNEQKELSQIPGGTVGDSVETEL
jgi:hypothetical protein